MKGISRKSAEGGVAAVEFALVLPLMILLLVGIVECGLLFYNQQVLTNASREGARAGIAYATTAKIRDTVERYCRRNIQSSRLIRFDTDANPVITVTPDPPPSSYGQDLTVTVSWDYNFLGPDLLGFGPNMQLTAQTVMKMESVAEP